MSAPLATPPARHSAVYRGHVVHRRRDSVGHAFSYRLHQVYVDLDELPALTAPGGPLARRWWRPWRFVRADYLGPAQLPLRTAVLDEVERRLGRRPEGAVRMLTNLRTFGFVFNPVTFYYVFEQDGSFACVLAEITNTPWRERFCYLVAADSATTARGAFAKAFHVSPFQPMEQQYRWRFTVPGEHLGVAMQNLRGDDVVFEAALGLAREPLTRAALARAWRSQPWITAKVIVGIYWNAALLWWKGAKFQRHPKKRRPPVPAGRPARDEAEVMR